MPASLQQKFLAAAFQPSTDAEHFYARNYQIEACLSTAAWALAYERGVDAPR